MQNREDVSITPLRLNRDFSLVLSRYRTLPCQRRPVSRWPAPREIGRTRLFAPIFCLEMPPVEKTSGAGRVMRSQRHCFLILMEGRFHGQRSSILGREFMCGFDSLSNTRGLPPVIGPAVAGNSSMRRPVSVKKSSYIFSSSSLLSLFPNYSIEQSRLCRHPSIRTLCERLSLGASWVYSIQ